MTPSSPKSNSESVALYVTTTADENNGDQSGTGLSLRDAILEINSNPGQAYNVCLESGSIY